MKVFISHSRDEAWLAEMIGAELNNIEVDPYYYERNETGTVIDEKILEELRACDEFLILLTPTSIRSYWVLYELSVAHYLSHSTSSRKPRIVPFFMYITEQEIPPYARNVSRRPISEIRTYYDELRGRTAPAFVGDSVSALGLKPPPATDVTLEQAAHNPQELFERVRRIMAASAAAPPSPPALPSAAPPENSPERKEPPPKSRAAGRKPPKVR